MITSDNKPLETCSGSICHTEFSVPPPAHTSTNTALHASMWALHLRYQLPRWSVDGNSRWVPKGCCFFLLNWAKTCKLSLFKKLTSLVTLYSHYQRGFAENVAVRSWHLGNRRPCTHPWWWRLAGCNDPTANRQDKVPNERRQSTWDARLDCKLAWRQAGFCFTNDFKSRSMDSDGRSGVFIMDTFIFLWGKTLFKNVETEIQRAYLRTGQ